MLKQWLKNRISERRRVALRLWFYRSTSWWYMGNKRICNLCNRRFSKFLPYGIEELRTEACCPHCRSLERSRLLAFYLRREVFPVLKSGRVLHFAPEPSISRLFLEESSLNYLSVDINPELAMQFADIHQLSFADNQFELILNSHVLSVVPDDRKALSEMYRVLKPGGLLLLQEFVHDHQATRELPSNASLEQRQQFFSRDDLFRDYGQDFMSRVEEAGFRAIRLNYAASLSPETREKYRPDDGHGIFICRK
jgi:SAM-dependent methyltransferase